MIEELPKNLCYLCIDRHLPALSSKPALLYHNIQENYSKVFTYSDLYHQVLKISNALIFLGITQYDKILLFLPQIPESLFIILACSRLNITYVLISPSWNQSQLTKIIDDCKPKLIFTSSYCLDSNNNLIDYNNTLDEILENNAGFTNFLSFLIIIQRDLYQTTKIKQNWDLDYHTLLGFCGVEEIPVMNSFDDLSIFSLYQDYDVKKKLTKKVNEMIKLLEEITKIKKRENFVWLANSVLNSIEGLCFILYGPLFNGDATILLERNNTKVDIYLELIQKWKVSAFCGVLDLFEENERIYYDLNSLLMMIGIKKQGVFEVIFNKLNERNYIFVEISLKSQCIFNINMMKIECCDEVVEALEAEIKQMNNLNRIYIITMFENVNVFVEDKAFHDKIKQNIEESIKKSSLEDKITNKIWWVEKLPLFSEEKMTRKILKQILQEKEINFGSFTESFENLCIVKKMQNLVKKEKNIEEKKIFEEAIQCSPYKKLKIW